MCRSNLAIAEKGKNMKINPAANYNYNNNGLNYNNLSRILCNKLMLAPKEASKIENAD